MNKFILLTASVLAISLPASQLAHADSDADIIKSALSAAPEAIAKNASVMTWDMKSLKEGTNGFTCFPDDHAAQVPEPMCLDKGGMAWLQGIMTKKEPAPGMGFGYMLMGGGNADNSDPFATKPPDGKWDKDGPHVMLFGAQEAMASYPQPKAHPDTTAPYVMYPGTPYAHLMMPVQ